MNLRKLEIGSWRVWELWEEEIPAWAAQWRTLWETIIGKTYRRRPYPLEVLHKAQNVVTEFWRIFANTLGHLTTAWILYQLAAATWRAAT